MSRDHQWGPRARVDLQVLRSYVRERIGVDPLSGFTVTDWLVTPTQRLLELTAGDAVDSVSDTTILLTQPRLWRKLHRLYDRA